MIKAIKFRRDIQALRGLAVLLVILYHLKIPGFYNGFIGVDIFFVISGYLMASIYNSKSSKMFFIKRARRLLPAYWATLILTLIIGFVILAPSDFLQLKNQILMSMFFVPNFFFWSRNSYFQATDFNPLLNLWSLGVEFQFYLLVPLLCHIFISYKKLFNLIFVASLIVCLIVLTISPKTSFFLIPFRLWEFMFGYYISTNNHKLQLRLQAIYIYFALFIFVLILFYPYLDGFSSSLFFGHPSLISLAVVLITGLVIKVGFNTGQNTFMKILIKIGDYSYVIYLIHFPIIIFYNYVPFKGTILGTNTSEGLFTITALIALLGFVLHKFIELPGFSAKLNFPALIIVVLLIIPLVFISPIIQSSKFSGIQKNIAYSVQDRSQYRCGTIFRILSPRSKTCELTGIKSNSRILLLGNSHADSIKTTFSSIAQEFNHEVYFWVSNNPLMDTGSSVKEVLTEVKVKKINYVFIHYSDGAVSKEKFSELFSELDYLGVKVSFLGPIPVWPKSVPEVLWSKRDPNKVLNQNYSESLERNLYSPRMFEQLSSKKLKFYDMASILCDSECIFINSSEKLLYWDSSHLTLTGSNLYTPLFRKALLDLKRF
jgi:peptidoglycan/LPS O-acetylase OafA/YrhL